MAKKKVIDLRSAADVPSGDVNITYNGVRIAGFSEDTDATLKTGMKRVEHDIDIEYTKPAGGPVFVPFSFSDTAEQMHDIDTDPLSDDRYGFAAIMIYQNVDGQLYTQILTSAGTDHLVGILPRYNELSVPEKYFCKIYISSRGDILNVMLNDTPVAYDSETGEYIVSIDTAIYPVSGYTLTITDKQR